MSGPTATTSADATGSIIVVPKKLRDDAIVEAICLLQFQPSELPEVIIGRLSDESKWKGFTPNRLPLADIPAPVRHSDLNLKFQPIFALRNGDGSRVVQIGENVISYHLVGVKNYCGWEKFKTELSSAFETLFEKLSKPEVKKISFRYINAIVSNRHLISDVHQLDLDVRVGNVKLDGPINLNYIVANPSHVTTTRIAHPNFVQVIQGGTLPSGTSAVVDVEVTTHEKFSAFGLSEVMGWIEVAHSREKEAFFKLIPSQILEKLKEA